MSMIRIQFELPEDKVKELEGLMREAGISTKKDLINNSLTLLEWAIKERKAGKFIASVDERNNRLKELIMPALSFVQKNEEDEKSQVSLATDLSQLSIAT